MRFKSVGNNSLMTKNFELLRDKLHSQVEIKRSLMLNNLFKTKKRLR